MTYEEKARLLARETLNKFINIGYLKDFGGMDLDLAKECALLEIDGRIEEVEHWKPRVIFLQEVKQEIFNF
jgi:hypothetical protein